MNREEFLAAYNGGKRDFRYADLNGSDARDKKAAEAFFKSCALTTGTPPTQITTDIEPAFASAIKNALGDDIKHRNSKYMNNIIEQDHRGIKSRYRSMKGFKDSWCAMIICTVFEEIRRFFRVKNQAQA